jgi:hypothetical protein
MPLITQAKRDQEQSKFIDWIKTRLVDWINELIEAKIKK